MTGIMTNTCFLIHIFIIVCTYYQCPTSLQCLREILKHSLYSKTPCLCWGTPTISSQGLAAAQRSLGRGNSAGPTDFSPELSPRGLAAEWQRSRYSRRRPAGNKKKRLTLNRTGGLRLQPTSGLVFRSTAFISIVLRLCPSNVWVSSMRFWFFIPTFLLWKCWNEVQMPLMFQDGYLTLVINLMLCWWMVLCWANKQLFAIKKMKRFCWNEMMALKGRKKLLAFSSP